MIFIEQTVPIAVLAHEYITWNVSKQTFKKMMNWNVYLLLIYIQLKQNLPINLKCLPTNQGV